MAFDWHRIVFSDRYDIDRIDQRSEPFIRRSMIAARMLTRYHGARVTGLDRIPAGAGLYVANHNGGPVTPDSWIFGAAVFDHLGLDDLPFGLGHEWAIRLRGAHSTLVRLGAVRACHENAERLFDADRKVLVYPGGDVDSCRPYARRHRIEFGGRQGYIRLALRSGVPIIPVVTCGAHSVWVVLSDGRRIARTIRSDRWLRMKAWPVTLTIPWGITVGFPPPFIPLPSRILIEVLEPIHFERTGPKAAEDDLWVAECAARVETAMQACLDDLVVERRRLGRLGLGSAR